MSVITFNLIHTFINLIHTFSTIPVKLPETYFMDTDKLILRFIWKRKRLRTANTVWKENNKVGRLTLPLPGSSVLRCLLEFIQIHVHWVSDAIQPNHLILDCLFLLFRSIFPSIRIFSSESSLRITWPKYWSFSFSIIKWLQLIVN